MGNNNGCVALLYQAQQSIAIRTCVAGEAAVAHMVVVVGAFA